jgi:starch synthase (maltosyl-transferring)
MMSLYPDLSLAVEYSPALEVQVDSKKAVFSTWYELFPRSTGSGSHGTFRDCERRLPEIAAMGFDVLYLPPIHPIGFTNRKGRNNTTVSEEGDPESWQ